jgi:hypothetical protein
MPFLITAIEPEGAGPPLPAMFTGKQLRALLALDFINSVSTLGVARQYLSELASPSGWSVQSVNRDGKAYRLVRSSRLKAVQTQNVLRLAADETGERLRLEKAYLLERLAYIDQRLGVAANPSLAVPVDETPVELDTPAPEPTPATPGPLKRKENHNA